MRSTMPATSSSRRRSVSTRSLMPGMPPSRLLKRAGPGRRARITAPDHRLPTSSIAFWKPAWWSTWRRCTGADCKALDTGGTGLFDDRIAKLPRSSDPGDHGLARREPAVQIPDEAAPRRAGCEEVGIPSVPGRDGLCPAAGSEGAEAHQKIVPTARKGLLTAALGAKSHTC